MARERLETMNATSTTEAWPEIVQWLARHAGFPRRRLESRAELMVCVAALAAAEENAQQRHALTRRDPAQTAALKTHALRRSQVHFKCDNSAKV
jgi:hypothetical protein